MNEDDFDALLSLDDPDFSAKFATALGVKPGDTIEVVTPQFTRTDDIVPSIPDSWQRLRSLPRATLKAIGCCAWDEPDERGMVLMLFPGEWYSYIPADFPIVDINGEHEHFRPGVTDDAVRFGCLAYGIEVPT